MDTTLTALKRDIRVGTRIACLAHWADEAGYDEPPLAGDVRTVIKVGDDAYAWTSQTREGRFWSYWPGASNVSFDQDGTFTITYTGTGTATFQVLPSEVSA